MANGRSGNLTILNSKNTRTLLGKGDKGGIIGCVAGLTGIIRLEQPEVTVIILVKLKMEI